MTLLFTRIQNPNQSIYANPVIRLLVGQKPVALDVGLYVLCKGMKTIETFEFKNALW